MLRDHFFNSGSRNAGKVLQRALNVRGAGLVVDGVVGPRTRQELQDQLAATGEAAFLVALHERRQAFYRSCRQFPVFGKGWLNRCDDAFSVAQELV
jgi:lysozyme family protein